ncbi:dihydroxyacetone kinase subunit DhaK [Martelella soudanensis]|uniref:dihydroxyacetone kinase subunit DhaK n=1 Tax=unclassified Martelella TaxID=2629616 RepID=UPI0015DE26B9|nr:MULTISPECIES: dihydroxyacetone kinase subunit DhaK [unclassified Martelella]
MAQFINAKEDIIQDALNGLVAASGGRLSRLDGYPFIRVMLRSDWDKSKVAVISGGGSGHEPAHAGFVGAGMLTAAICGDVFASPSVDAVLAGIRAVTGEAGCVLIVKNYTGDRLNFGLAAARARELGLKVNMVIIQDDIAIPGITQPRGVAGTLFVHKIAGATAEAGGDLDAVTEAAERAAGNVFSIGMSLSTCTMPGGAREDRLAEGEIELGLGIHGEPGAEKLRFETAGQALSVAIKRLEPHLKASGYVAMLNNLGGTTTLEMSILAETLRTSRIGDRISHLIGPASMMTALDMHGFSISLYPADREDLERLAAATPISAWPGLNSFAAPGLVALPAEDAAARFSPSSHPQTEAFLKSCCAALIDAERDLNALDAKSGDGDTGTTLATAARAILDGVERLPLADQTLLLRAIGQTLSETMGGSSGVLLAIFFSAAAEASAENCDLIAALSAGLSRMQDVGGAKPGDRTMIDALAPALQSLEDGVGAAARAARTGANATTEMTRANAGRASYVGASQLAGHTDPGAEAVARLFEHIATRAERDEWVAHRNPS